jgi:hypothetical protein
MNKKKTPKKNTSAAPPRPAPVEVEEAGGEAVRWFAKRIDETLGRLPKTAEQIKELLERLDEAESGLLGGNLLAIVNEAVLGEQAGRLAQSLSPQRGQPEDLADRADFVGRLVTEYGALIKVLAEVELEPDSPLSRDWQQVAESLLRAGSEIQDLAEQFHVQLEGEEQSEAGPAAASASLLENVWKRLHAGEELSHDDAALARVMHEHSEYRVAWEAPERLSGGTMRGVNPYLHVTLHSIVENQLELNDPPEVRAALDRLLAADISRHEAIHRIGNLALERIWRTLRESRPFDREAYVRALNQLK